MPGGPGGGMGIWGIPGCMLPGKGGGGSPPPPCWPPELRDMDIEGGIDGGIDPGGGRLGKPGGGMPGMGIPLPIAVRTGVGALGGGGASANS